MKSESINLSHCEITKLESRLLLSGKIAKLEELMNLIHETMKLELFLIKT